LPKDGRNSFPPAKRNGLRLYFTHIEKLLSPSELADLIVGLPESIQEQLMAYQRPEDATASYIGKCLVQYAYQTEGIPFSWHDVAFTEKEKPFLPGSALQFNISHSGNLVVVALGEASLGVDVEKKRHVNTATFNRQFSEKEWEQINSSTDPSATFIEFWSIKEAAIKADGRGMTLVAQTFIESNCQVIVEGRQMYYELAEIARGFSCAVCADKPSALQAIVPVGQNQLPGFYKGTQDHYQT
jgi:4'-phosphopantetheinyl transferase